MNNFNVNKKHLKVFLRNLDNLDLSAGVSIREIERMRDTLTYMLKLMNEFITHEKKEQ